MSQAKLSHVQNLRQETKSIHNDLNAEMLALSKVTREGLLRMAGRVVALERERRLIVAELVLLTCVVAWLVFRV